MTPRLGAVVLAALAAGAQAAPPTYDTQAYCAKTAEAVGGSYHIEQGCRQQEAAARAQFTAAGYPPRIAGYCDQVAQAVGGSYQILNGCAQRESQARDAMR